MFRRLVCLTLSLLMVLSVCGVALADDNAAATEPVDTNSGDSAFKEDMSSYFDYYRQYSEENAPEGFIELNQQNVVSAENKEAALKTVEGVESIVLDGGNTFCEWEFDVEETGIYSIYVDYLAQKGQGKDIMLSVSIDGQRPYNELVGMTLPRLWKDKIAEGNEETYFERDSIGNDMRPSQEELNIWTSKALSDTLGLYTAPYILYLEAGTHRLKFELVREAVAIKSVRVGNDNDLVKYDDYIKKYSGKEAEGDEPVYLQAEQTYYKNNTVLYATYDNSNASTQPSDPAYTRYNTIGGANWNASGDAISWKVNVKKAGLYKIALRVKQTENQGLKSYRTLKVNGEIPFKELENIGFDYKQNWYVKTLGDDEEDYYVYLEPGDVISLECTTGPMASVLRNVQQAITDLNTIYREIVAVTTTDPDVYRDYFLEDQIPGIAEDIDKIREFLVETSSVVKKITGDKGSQASNIEIAIKNLEGFAEHPDTLSERLGTFKGDIETLSSLILTLNQQTLQIDYIAFLPEDVEAPKVSDGFWNSLVFTVKQFASSFVVDYNSMGNEETAGKTISVWVSTGRDQTKIINNLIKDKFTAKTGININLAMVDTGGTLIKATLAGKGPDAALMIGENFPMELAARGALVDISQFGIEDIYNQFHESAWTPFRYQDGIYAIPETQSFEMAFYRTDIFEDLGLTPPNTWDEFYKMMEIIQGENLVVGIMEINAANMGLSAGIGTFDKFFLQNGGTYYSNDLKTTMFDTEIAHSAFEQWVELYSKYGLDRDFNFYSRFRTGEMPYSFQGYASYNQLQAAAPELRGLWAMAPIPGTLREDGTIDRSESGTATGCIMLNSAVDHNVGEETVEFLKWWSNGETQALYGNELESILGIASRYTPANLEAFETIGWTESEQELLKEQWQWVKIQRQIPGNYILGRSLTSAFRSAYAGTNSPRRALTIYNKTINDELERKRKEFNLD